MDRIYTVLNEIQKGTTSAKELFGKVNEVFKNNLVEFQIFLDNIASEAYIRFLGGENSPVYGDIILTDKGRDYLKHNKARNGLKDYTGTCKSNGQMKCKEYFITDINDLCDTCPQRAKIESVRNTMILRFETLKSVNSKEKTIEYLNERIDNANKSIIDLINKENTGGAEYRENRVGMLLSYKDCLLYYNEQLKIIQQENIPLPPVDDETRFYEEAKAKGLQVGTFPFERYIIEKRWERDSKKTEIQKQKDYDIWINKDFSFINTVEDFNREMAARKLALSQPKYIEQLLKWKEIYGNSAHYYMIYGPDYLMQGHGGIYQLIKDELDRIIATPEKEDETKSSKTDTPQSPAEIAVATYTFDYTNADKYLFGDKVAAFQQIENDLCLIGYINNTGTWQRGKKDLVAFIHILYILKYLRQQFHGKSIRTTLLEHRRFFERRYHISIEQEMKPSKFPPEKLREYKYTFHFINGIDKI